MKKFIVSLSTVAALSLPISNAMAQSHAFANSNQMQVGFYLKLPFSGGLPSAHEQGLHYGFQAGFQRDYRTDLSFNGNRQRFQAKLIDLKFSEQGFNAFSVAGQDLYRINRSQFGAAEGESLMTTTNILYALGAVAVVGLGIVLFKE